MLGKVIIENGVKKIQALTADTGTGAPVGSYLYLEKKSNPQGYLYCNGSTFDETAYPALYQYLGTNVLPDWREFSAVGAEQNTTSAVIATHDVFTQGQEKDDQLQEHTHSARTLGYEWGYGSSKRIPTLGEGNYDLTPPSVSTPPIIETFNQTGRKGTVTRGKSRAVFIYIKATSGLTENQQENVLNTINDNLSYSTEEHPTGKKWIDGKPIYSKVITGLALSGVKTDWTNTGITITNIEEITNAISYRLNPNGIISGNSYLVNTGGAIVYLSSTGQTIAKISFEYTKTTDV